MEQAEATEADDVNELGSRDLGRRPGVLSPPVREGKTLPPAPGSCSRASPSLGRLMPPGSTRCRPACRLCPSWKAWTLGLDGLPGIHQEKVLVGLTTNLQNCSDPPEALVIFKAVV